MNYLLHRSHIPFKTPLYTNEKSEFMCETLCAQRNWKQNCTRCVQECLQNPELNSILSRFCEMSAKAYIRFAINFLLNRLFIARKIAYRSTNAH